MGGKRHAPAALPPGKTRYPLYRRLGGPQNQVLAGAGNLAPIGIRSPDRPPRSEWLYRLSYRGPQTMYWILFTLLNVFILLLLLYYYYHHHHRRRRRRHHHHHNHNHQQ
jgi:hypothetical protein